VNAQLWSCFASVGIRRAPDDLIRNWLRNGNTIEFLGIWEF
jgi:hypothetical protein